MEVSNLNNCYSEEVSKANMQAIEINEYFRKTLPRINPNGDILDQVKRLKRAKGNKIWLTDEVLKSIDVLSFAIFTNKCILANWDKIKPRNVADAHLKLYAYVRYNAHIKLEIIENFDRCRAEFGFQYYDLVEIAGGRYNASQTFIYEQITMQNDNWVDKVADDEEAIRAAKKLICMVDHSKIDSSNNNTFYYVYRCKKSNELLNRMPDIIRRIQDGCKKLNQKSGLVNTSIIFDDNSYLFELIILPEYLKILNLADITEDFVIQVDPDGLKIAILRKKYQ